MRGYSISFIGNLDSNTPKRRLAIPLKTYEILLQKN